MLDAIRLQDFLFQKNPSRLDLLGYESACAKSPFKVFVYRNHSFELIKNTISAYLDFASINAEFEYSDYDDSLSFLNVNTEADLIILWLDLSRYDTEEVLEFLCSRLQYLKTIFKKPILFAPISGRFEQEEIGVLVADFSSIEKQLGEKFLDMRMGPHTGTNLSAQACLGISKFLGLKYIPAALIPNIKAIAIDLDNTLYSGVLGEDGVIGVELSHEHAELQITLKTLAASGILLCIVSKNNQSDVEELFEKRTDFPLQSKDFTKIYASWDSKSDSIEKMEKDLNIHHESILFVDDNVGEISSVIAGLPQIKFILAKEAGYTNNVLQNYPGLYKPKCSFEDSVRSKDLQANEARKTAQSAMCKEEYLNSLEIQLNYSIDDPRQVDRISELANKTNQFVFSYKRYTKTQVQELIEDSNRCLIAISLKDILSDSGIVGVLAGKKDGDTAVIEELFVSCRALGRGLDEIMIFKAIEICLKTLVCDKLKVDFTKGDRNEPAYKFAHKNLAKYLKGGSPYEPFQLEERIKTKEIITSGV